MFSVIKKFVILIILAGFLTSAKIYTIITQYIDVPNGFVEYTVNPGTSLNSIANELKELNIIEHPLVFKILAKLRGVSKNLQAGEYQISSKMSLDSLLDLFVLGDVKQHSVTIIEGSTFKQMIDTLKGQVKLKNTILNKSEKEIMKTIGYPTIPPEGRFFPDTYFYTTGMTDIEILIRAYNRLDVKLKKYWENREKNLPYSDENDALTLASIIQKESGKFSEYERIAGVYVKRLNKGMRLQADPTVIYGFNLFGKRELLPKYLKQQNPYNTYKNNGLPPTPIAMVGERALRAAFFPEIGEELYFVANGEGGHYFSKSLKEHRRAIQRFLKNK